ncbi:MAG: cation:proton antiporter [Actinomycetota bacterium]
MKGTDQATVSLLVIVGAALALPLLASRMRLPAVVLEIVFGILIGPVTHVVDPAQYLDVLADLGFLLLMFLSGFEIDLRTFGRRLVAPLIWGSAIFALTVVGAFSASRLLGHGGFLTFVLATTSVGLVVPSLRATRRSSTGLGQVILLSALLADLLTILGVTAYALVEEHGALRALLAIPAFLMVVGGSLLALRRLVWWRPEWFERLFQPGHPEEIGTRATLALMLVFVAVAIAFGIEKILGVFLAGTGFAVVFRNRGVLGEQLSGFAYGFLVPVFFINVGIGFDIGALSQPGAVAGMLGLLGLAVAVKAVPALLLLFRRHSLREVLAAGALLSARLSLIIAVAEVGARLGFIDHLLKASIIALAVVTATLAPIAFRWLAPPLAAPDSPRGPGFD